MTLPIPDAGAVFEIDYPFVRVVYEAFEEEGPQTLMTWKPGCEYEYVGPEGETMAVYDGTGKQVLSVVDTFKPGHYPRRVFYTRKWIAPDGREFGRSNLHICTLEKFTRLTRGFMAHDRFFEMEKRNMEAAE